MKVKKLMAMGMTVLTILGLTACGGGSSYATNVPGFDIEMASDASKSGYYTSGSYSGGTTISGDYADYSYSFSATGSTKKSKNEMLDCYEELQGIVIDNDGFISDVNNNYRTYVIAPDDNYITDSEKYYVSSGTLRFTIEIPEDNVGVVIEWLEDFVNENKFTVTYYNQRIVNYQNYKIVEDYDDSYRYGVITEEELASRLQYTSFYVDLSYYTLRSGIEKFGITLKRMWLDLADICEPAVVVVIIIAIALLIFYFEFLLFYRLFKRVQYRNSKKRPHYYAPTKVMIVKSDEE